MGRSRTLQITAPQVAAQGELAPILMRLMLSVNDIAIAAHMLNEWRESTDRKKVSRKNGGGMYFVRLIMSHVHEALRIVKMISQTDRFREKVFACDKETIKAFEEVERFTKSEAEWDMLFNFRNKIGFHYDWNLSGEVLQAIAVHPKSKDAVFSYSMGTEPLDWHFELGDAVMDWMVVRKIFQLDYDRTPERTEKTVAIAARQQEIAIRFTDFAAHFVAHYAR